MLPTPGPSSRNEKLTFASMPILTRVEPMNPCPVCGSAKLRPHGFSTAPPGARYSREAIHHAWIECAHCGVEGPQVDYPAAASSGQRSKVMQAWNDWTRRLPRRAFSDRRDGPAIR